MSSFIPLDSSLETGTDVNWGGRITIASLLSFIAGAFAASRHVCYAAVASGSVVLILPVSAPLS